MLLGLNPSDILVESLMSRRNFLGHPCGRPGTDVLPAEFLIHWCAGQVGDGKLRVSNSETDHCFRV
jgi:hypothetical protein